MRPDPQGLGGHLVHGDDHDLAGQDEVGGDGALDDSGLRRRSPLDRRGIFFGGVVAAEFVPDLLGTLIAEVGATQHEDERDGSRKEGTDGQQCRQNDQQLVPERSPEDLLDHREFTGRVRTGYVLRGDGGVVNHYAGGLCPGLGGAGSDVVHGGGRYAGNGCDVVQQGDKAAAHWGLPDGLRLGCWAWRPRSRRVIGMQRLYERSPVRAVPAYRAWNL